MGDGEQGHPLVIVVCAKSGTNRGQTSPQVNHQNIQYKVDLNYARHVKDRYRKIIESHVTNCKRGEKLHGTARQHNAQAAAGTTAGTTALLAV